MTREEQLKNAAGERRASLLAEIDKIDSEPNIEVFQDIKQILNKVFGEEYNQISLNDEVKIDKEKLKKALTDLSDSYYRSYDDTQLLSLIGAPYPYFITIYTPEAEIRNEKEKHTIRDIWVRLQLSHNGHISSQMMGTRSSATVEEYLCGYKHSHLHVGYANTGFGPFCLGSGPLVSLLNSLKNKYDSKIFEMTLLSIKSYLRWESISGVPYIRMQEVSNRQGSINSTIEGIEYEDRSLYVESAFKHLKKNGKLSTAFSVKLQDGMFTLTLNDEEEQSIVEFLLSSPYRDAFDAYICMKNTDGKYVSETLVDVKLPFQTRPMLKFKGNDIYFKILNEEKNVKVKKKYIHPLFKRELEIRATNYFNKKAAGFNSTGSGSPIEDKLKATVAS